jgi:hypothetical protein
VDDPAGLVKLAAKAAAARPDDLECQEVAGLALYRAGKYDEALKQLRLAADRQGRNGWVETQLFLAMTCRRLKENGEARDWLTKAEKQMDRHQGGRDWLRGSWDWLKKGMPPGDKAGRAITWEQRLRWQLLRREAETLLAGNP